MTNTKTTGHFRDVLRAARRSGTPLVCVRTADAASAINHVVCSLNGKVDDTPLLTYDLINGLSSHNNAGQVALQQLGDGTPDPVETLEKLPDIKAESIIFFHNAQRLWDNPAVIQGIWNLRDIFKSAGTMLILLTTIGTTLPAELQSDVMVFDEPLPSASDLEAIIDSTFEAADLEKPKEEIKTKAVDALIGLANFPAEQVLAMSLSKQGVDLEMLWERKRQAVEQTPGLAIWRGGETFDDIGGCDNIKKFMSAVIAGKEPPRVIVFLDEIEKAFAGTGTDMSGVKTEMTGCLLSFMQDRNADGCIFIGPPGAAKSAIAKAAGATAGIPTVAFDLSAMQSGIVGSSGERLRAALQVVDAISQGQSLWIGTCNSIGTLPPELRRRFALGTFMFDLPSPEERWKIWKIYQKKWGLENELLPPDEGWTGAEIKECCRKAYRLGLNLELSARYIVPVSKSAGEQIENLRKQASGKFLSASHPGIYDSNPKPVAVETGGRKIRKGE